MLFVGLLDPPIKIGGFKMLDVFTVVLSYCFYHIGE